TVEGIAVFLQPPAADVQVEVAVGGLDVEPVGEGRLEIDLCLRSRFLLVLSVEAHRRGKPRGAGGAFRLELLKLRLELFDPVQFVAGAWGRGLRLLRVIVPVSCKGGSAQTN